MKFEMRIQQNNKIFRVTQKDRVPPVKAEVAGLSPAPEKQTHCLMRHSQQNYQNKS